MPTLRSVLIVILAVTLVSSTAVKIEKGWLTLNVVTGSQQEEYKVEYNGHVKDTLALTQSSKINIRAKVNKLRLR